MQIDPGGSAPVGSPSGAVLTAFDGMSSAIADLVDAGNQGFSISETGGQALINALEEAISDLEVILNDTQSISREPPLGSTPAALVYKPFLATIANDPVQGFIPAAHKLVSEMGNAIQAIKKSMATTAAADEDAGRNITSSGRSA